MGLLVNLGHQFVVRRFGSIKLRVAILELGRTTLTIRIMHHGRLLQSMLIRLRSRDSIELLAVFCVNILIL